MTPIKKVFILLAFAFIMCLGAGCETYSKSNWTPDSFNYTLQRDRTTGDMSDYFGLSWNLKPSK